MINRDMSEVELFSIKITVSKSKGIKCHINNWYLIEVDAQDKNGKIEITNYN